MLLSPDALLLPSGPPPQTVLDQRWLWRLLLLMLVATLILRLVGLDIAGSLLTALMLCLAVMITRDGMQEMGKYVLIYAMLCGLNFFFDILPLITELGGRITRSTVPVASTKSDDGVRQTTYTLTTQTTPFFDSSQGFIYNVQSVAMIMSPLTMFLGVYLSVSAHNEIQRHSPGPLFDEEFPGNFQNARPQATGPATRPAQQSGNARSNNARGLSGQETFERFHGAARKLDN